MRLNRIILTFFIILLLNNTGAQTQFEGNTHIFNLGVEYEMSSFTKAPLKWTAESNETVYINVTLTQLPDIISSIEVQYITIKKYVVTNNDEIGTQEGFKAIVTEQEFNQVGQEFSFKESIDTPILGDLFYLNITIFAFTKGNISQSESVPYSYRFPVDNTIIVDRENDLVPLINLYGFPPRSFFENWFPIYLAIIVLILTPAYIAGIYKIKSARNKKEESD